MARRPQGSILVVAGALAATLVVARLDRVAAAAPAAGDREARELFQKAEMSFNMGRFPDALANYQAAYEAKPLPAFLFNVAQCYRNLQQYEKARFFYRRYLALDPRTANRRLVEQLIAEMTSLVDKGESKSEASKVAPAPAATAPPPVVLPMLTAPAPAPPPAEATLQTTSPAKALDETARASPPIYRRWWFWGGIGAVLVAAVTITIFATRGDATPTGSLGTINGR